MANRSSIAQALKIVLRKPAPDVIPLSDWGKVRVRDYFSATFSNSNDDRAFLVDKLENENLIGRWVCRTAEPENAVVSIVELSDMSLTIRQYIGELEIRYTSPTEFVWHSRLHIPRIKLLRKRVTRAFHAKKPLTRSNQMTVLRNLLDHAVAEGDWKYVEYLMEDIYDDRWSSHPQGFATYRYTQLLLDSLVASGDLEASNGQYNVTPRAVATIINHEPKIADTKIVLPSNADWSG